MLFTSSGFGQSECQRRQCNKAYVAQFGEAVKCRLIMVAERARALELHGKAKASPEQFANLAKNTAKMRRVRVLAG